MDNISQEIYFKLIGIHKKDTCYKLKDKTWLFSVDGEFGVGIEIPFTEKNKISEWANNLHFSSQKHTFSFRDEKVLDLSLLCLTTTSTNLLQEFAYICAEFCFEKTKELLDIDPLLWWDKWKELLGNSISEFSPVSILAEMIILKYLIMQDKYVNLQWKSTDKELTHDITSLASAHEVKSTMMRYDNIIHISGQHQLKHNKPLFLYLCRFEETSDGIYSIASIYKDLIRIGYDKANLDKAMKKMKIDLHSETSKQKYNVLEIKQYLVDDNFPKIDSKSFVGGKIPNGIISLSYTIDLTSLEYNNIEL